MTTSEMKIELEAHGYVCGARDPRINTDHAGAFMVVQGPYSDDELPTPDAENGPWAIVGDDLDALIRQAYEHHEFWSSAG